MLLPRISTFDPPNAKVPTITISLIRPICYKTTPSKMNIKEFVSAPKRDETKNPYQYDKIKVYIIYIIEYLIHLSYQCSTQNLK